MTTTTDHRVDIRAYARDVEADMGAMLALQREEASWGDVVRLQDMGLDDSGMDVHDLLETYALDVEHTARHDNQTGEWSEPEDTRLLVTFGGPTVWINYSHRYQSAELSHSWGREPAAFAAHRRREPGKPGLEGVPGTETGVDECADRHTWSLDPQLVGDFLAAFYPHPLEV